MFNGKAVILVVEDSALIRMSAVDLVLSAGYEALEAHRSRTTDGPVAFPDRSRWRLRRRFGTRLGVEDPFGPGSFDNSGLRVANVFHATLLASGHNHSFARMRPGSRPSETRQSFWGCEGSPKLSSSVRRSQPKSARVRT